MILLPSISNSLKFEQYGIKIFWGSPVFVFLDKKNSLDYEIVNKTIATLVFSVDFSIF
jgi:hypothetical protein